MNAFKDRLNEALRLRDMKPSDLARLTKINEASISEYRRGGYKATQGNLEKIAVALRVPIPWLMGASDEPPDFPPQTGGVWVPVLGKIAAGIPIEAIEEILDYEEIPASLAAQGEFFALKVKGNSMEPRILDGDVVIVRQQSDADSGEVVVVIVNGEDVTVKRIKKRPEGIMLIPNNHAYTPMFYSNKEIEELPVVIIGKVVELRGKSL